MNKDEQVAVSKPKWLEDFLKKTFFGFCTDHKYKKNDLNKYCIDCDLSTCQFCLSSGSHRHHKILKIYRHVRKEVVCLAAMEKFIDCSQIQPYKCNKQMVIPLSPLPHAGSASNDEAPCNTCNRRLTEPDLYRYCSISCKFKGVPRKRYDSVPPFVSIESPPEVKEEETSEPSNPPEEKMEEPAEPAMRKRKRKGTPRKSPFF